MFVLASILPSIPTETKESSLLFPCNHVLSPWPPALQSIFVHLLAEITCDGNDQHYHLNNTECSDLFPLGDLMRLWSRLLDMNTHWPAFSFNRRNKGWITTQIFLVQLTHICFPNQDNTHGDFSICWWSRLYTAFSDSFKFKNIQYGPKLGIKCLQIESFVVIKTSTL